MKAPAFQWYAADYLADERVTQLSLASEAAYVRLLNYCWREGSIPAKAEQCAPMCKYADVKVIKPALALFMKSPTQPGRLVHKRLEEERAKQDEFRARQSAKGAKGGRPRKEDEKPGKAGALPGLSSGLAPVKPDESSLSSTSSSIPSDDGSAGEASSSSPDVLPASLPERPDELAGRPAVGGDPVVRAMALAHSDPADEQRWNEGPLSRPVAFRAICERLGFEKIDFEHYRKQALVSAEGISRTIAQWQSWIRNYLNNQLRHGPLLRPTDGEAARTGVHAPQSPAAYRHEVLPEVQAQRDREREEREAAKIAANFANRQPQGQATQPVAIAGAV